MIREHNGGATYVRPVIRSMMAGLAVLVCLIGTASCSSGTEAADTGSNSTHSSNRGTGDTARSADDTGTDPSANFSTAELETIAKRFAACLVEKGFDAKITGSYALLPIGSSDEAPQTTVVVRRLGADRTPIVPGPGVVISADSDPLYPDVMYTIVSAKEGAWVGFKNSKSLTGSIYADKQADYAACEAANPDFAQPNYSSSSTSGGGSAGSASTDSDKQQILIDFARKARADGFNWMADPAPGETQAVEIPPNVSYEELRRFFDTYSGDQWPSHDGIPFGTSCSGQCAAYNQILSER
ncbi:uridine kinase [Bifidobacterium imperatoris]|nr:uridine kinase [Bifidobacterium imperatoris]